MIKFITRIPLFIVASFFLLAFFSLLSSAFSEGDSLLKTLTSFVFLFFSILIFWMIFQKKYPLSGSWMTIPITKHVLLSVGILFIVVGTVFAIAAVFIAMEGGDSAIPVVAAFGVLACILFPLGVIFLVKGIREARSMKRKVS